MKGAGVTTPSLGIPVNFAEICKMSVICEVSSSEAGFMPEVSYGSHFFQNLVETGIIYVAIIHGNKEVLFNPEQDLKRKNLLESILPQSKSFQEVIHISKTEGREIFSDIASQTVLCG